MTYFMVCSRIFMGIACLVSDQTGVVNHEAMRRLGRETNNATRDLDVSRAVVIFIK